MKNIFFINIQVLNTSYQYSQSYRHAHLNEYVISSLTYSKAYSKKCCWIENLG